jgi:uncharacterized protein (TIGR02145 family)
MIKKILIINVVCWILVQFSCLKLEHSNPLDPEYHSTNTAPAAVFSVSPTSGDTNTTFSVDASGSSDSEDTSAQLEVRWDWENDGTWDTGYSTSKTASHQYATTGSKTINLQVQDTGGLTAEHTETVTVSAGTVTYGSMTGNDGKTYKTIIIGSQEWMAENLRETQYRDGSAIPDVIDNTTWTGLSTGARCAYDNSETTADTYGYIYNWFAVDDIRYIAPAGWHVPTDAEWTILTDYLGGISVAGGKLKEAGTTHWISPNTGATDDSHFTGLPAGYRDQTDGTYRYLGQITYYWSATLQFSTNAYTRRLDVGSTMCPGYAFNKKLGYSVRLIKD